VLSDEAVDAEAVLRSLGQTRQILLVRPKPSVSSVVPQAGYVATEPAWLPEPAVFDWVRRTGARVAIFLQPPEATAARVILRFVANGVRALGFHDLATGSWHWRDARAFVFEHGLGFLGTKGRNVRDALSDRWQPCRDTFWHNLVAREPPLAVDGRHVTHVISSLGPGGAERQLTLLASATSRVFPTTVLVDTLAEDRHRHYAAVLDSAGVPCEVLRRSAPWPEHLRLRSLRVRPPPPLAFRIGALVRALGQHPPGILHCWLDAANVAGGIAAHVVGVPRAVLRVGSGSPQQWAVPWYRLLCDSPRVSLVANSHFSRERYAAALRVPTDRIRLIPNGIDRNVFRPLDEDQRAARRSDFGIGASAPVIAGAFRLHSQKRPFDFLRVVSELRRRWPDLTALLAGIGPIEGQVREAVARQGLATTVRLLGRRDDVEQILGMADLCLHTSARESAPNVLIEAQALGVPVVATAAGGTAELVLDGRTGLVCPIGDVPALTAGATRLLGEAETRDEYSRAATAWANEAFAAEAMCGRFLRLYEEGIRSPARAGPAN
jgi:glycosyltransferase involved in cell wall biosynthesis